MSGRDSLARPATRPTPPRRLALVAGGDTRGRRPTLVDATAPQRPCAGANAVLFETDTGDAFSWADAAARCDGCPFLNSCRADLEAAHPDWGPGRRAGNPSAVVWAGLIFGPDRRLWTRRGLARAAAVTAGITARRRRRAPIAADETRTGPRTLRPVPRPEAAAGDPPGRARPPETPTTGWQRHARCRDTDPAVFLPSPGEDSATAVLARLAAVQPLCRACPVTADCLRWALDTEQDRGLWAATTPAERRALRAADAAARTPAATTDAPPSDDRPAGAGRCQDGPR